MAAAPNPSDLTRHQLDELDALLQRMLAMPLAGGSPPAESHSPPLTRPEATAGAPAATPPGLPSGWRLDPPQSPGLAGFPPLPTLPNLASLPPLPSTGGLPGMAHPQPSSSSNLSGAVSYEIPVPVAPRPPRIDAEPSQPRPPIVEESEPPATVPLFGPPPRTLRGIDAPPIRPLRADTLDAPETADPAAAEITAELTAIPLTLAPGSATDAEAVPDSPPFWAWPVVACNQFLEAILSLFGPVGQGLMHPATKNLLAGCGVLMLLGAGLWAARGLGWLVWALPN